MVTEGFGHEREGPRSCLLSDECITNLLLEAERT